jgi:uncharacterized membrane protein
MGLRGFVAGAVVGAGLVYYLDAPGGSGSKRAAGRAGARYGSRQGDLAGLEAANLPPRRPLGGSSGALLAAAGALMLYGLTRRGGMASLARTVGTGLIAGNLRREVPASPGERRRVVDIQKSIHIAVSPEEAFAFWDTYESFPLFMSNIREIEDLGGGRSRWTVSGPGGLPISWEAVLTQRVPGEMLAWRSAPGSMLENAGVIRFTPDRGGTRVDLRFCYQPPAGGAGRAVAELVGADPRAKLNEDLGRLKAVLEGSTRSEAHGQESGA